jgi:hypothetical protein
MFDPFAFYFFLELEAHLRRENFGCMNEDLLERSRVAAENARFVDNSWETTIKRHLWACREALALLLAGLRVEVGVQKDDQALTPEKLDEIARALHALHDSVGVDITERTVETPRDATQISDIATVARNKMLFELIGVVTQTAILVRGEDAAAVEHAKHIVADQFYQFLFLAGASKDRLVEYAEKMVEVHA